MQHIACLTGAVAAAFLASSAAASVQLVSDSRSVIVTGELRDAAGVSPLNLQHVHVTTGGTFSHEFAGNAASPAGAVTGEYLASQRSVVQVDALSQITGMDLTLSAWAYPEATLIDAEPSELVAMSQLQLVFDVLRPTGYQYTGSTSFYGGSFSLQGSSTSLTELYPWEQYSGTLTPGRYTLTLIANATSRFLDSSAEADASLQLSFAHAPEPATALLVALGAVGVLTRRRPDERA